MSRLIDTTYSATTRAQRSASQSVEKFLLRFSHRQWMLHFFCTIAWSIVAFLLGILFIVAIDSLFPLQSAWRWSLTCLVYVGAIVFALRFGSSDLLFRKPTVDVAWQIEQLHPSLRESLLATVQLRQTDGTTRSGSQFFLDAIERKVAREIGYLNVQSMLPAKSVYTSAYWLTGLFWLILIACFVPHIRFAERLVRAIVPFVAFDDTDRSTTVPEDPNPKVVGFHFTITPPKYTLVPEGNKTSPRGDLRLLKGSKLKLEMDVDQTLDSASLALEFPDTGGKNHVALLDAKTIASNRPSNKPLHPGSKQRLTFEIVVDKTFLYDVRLVSDRKLKGKRLENTYSPRYRIDAIDDLHAELKWQSIDKTPWQESIANDNVRLVANDATIELSLSVSDNLPVEQLIHEASVNRGPWIAIHSDLGDKTLASGPSDAILDITQVHWKAMIDWKWQLSGMDVRSGDSIATRVTATDKKGNQSHSPTLVFSLAAKGFDPKRNLSLMKRCQIVSLLDSLSRVIHEDRETLRRQLLSLASQEISDFDRKERTEFALEKVSKYVGNSREIRSVALGMMKEIDRCADEAEIELLYRMLDRIEKEWLVEVAQGIASAQNPSKSSAKQLERMLPAYDASCDGVKQTANLFRQIVGLELQSAMTRDLTELRDYQQKEMQKYPLSELGELSRVGEVTIRYLDAVTKLATQVEPHVPNELRGRLTEWYQWIEQTRTGLHDLIHKETLEQTPRLRSQIEKCIGDLNRFRWVYHLQGHLAGEVNNSRKDLLQRSGPIRQPFAQFLNLQNQMADLSRDRVLATDVLAERKTAIREQVDGPVSIAFTQLSDRKEIHQSRQSADPEIVSDIGLTQRAWTQLLKRLSSESLDAEPIRRDAQAIAAAYRILESFHETVEARKVVQSLLPIEQYEWQGMEAQLWSPKQWDSVQARLEIAHQWMKDAGFPPALADRYNALRWSDPSNQVQRKIQSRRDPTQASVVSAADELRALLSLWAEADMIAKPSLDQAREVLAKLSPSVSQLAKDAAELTERLQRTAEDMATSNPAAPDVRKPESVPTSEEMQQERNGLEQSIAELQEALIELANKQNLLDRNEREAAKSSDQALKLIDSVLPEMNRAMEELQAQRNTSLHPSEDAIGKAVKAASESAATLQQIASHFSRLESHDKNLDESSANPIGDEQPLPSEDFYKKAESLADLRDSDPESLLKKLERELKRNPEMQSELSEISKSYVQSQTAELRLASEVELNLAKDLENSDGNLAGEKRLHLDQWRSSIERLDRIGLRLLGNGQTASQRSGAKEQSTRLGKTANVLRQASQVARAVSDDTSRPAVESAVRTFAGQLDKSLEELAAVRSDVRTTVEQPAHFEERIRQNIRFEAQNIQEQTRNELLHQLKELGIQTQRQLDSSNRRLQKAQSDFNQVTKERRSIQEKLAANPSDKSLENQLLRVTNLAEQALVKRSWEEQSVAQSERILNSASVQLSQFEKQEKANLDRPNPHAALAMEQLERAKEQLSQVREETSRVLDSLQQLPLPRTPSQKIEDDAIQQQRVGERITDAARQLARSSRHEERLGNEQGSQRLSAQAARVSELANGSVEAAKKELERAGSLSRDIEEQQSKSKKAQEIQEPFERTDLSPAQQSLAQASQELAIESKRTSELGDALQVFPQTTPSQLLGQDESEATSDSHFLKARDMARMLDLLDQRLFAESEQQPKTNAKDQSQSDAEAKGNEPSQNKSQSNPSSAGSKKGMNDQDRNGARSAFQDSLKSAADKLASAMGQGRLAQKEASQTKRTERSPSSNMSPKSTSLGDRDLSSVDPGSDSLLPGMTQTKNRDWGKLRGQRATDAIEGRRDEYDPEFEEAIQAYYRVLGNR